MKNIIQKIILANFIVHYSIFNLANDNNKIKVYLLSGQGSDYRLFSNLKLDTVHFDTCVIHYPVPQRGESMSSYAKTIANTLLKMVHT